jgi:UDP-N-acetylmuramoyl-tripeptide--D-alanyl-D-alanine ligase
MPRPRSFAGVEPGGAAVINRDSEFFDRLASAARRAGIGRIVGFGEHRQAEVRLEGAALHETCSCVTAEIFGEVLSYRLGAPGRHLVMNSLAVLAAAKLAGCDLARAAMALARLEPQKGRGVRFKLEAPDGPITVIDESYNANPASVRAALALLGQARPGRGGRRIAVLGDMLELGQEGPRLHAELAAAIDECGANIVYACGPTWPICGRPCHQPGAAPMPRPRKTSKRACSGICGAAMW